ARPARGRTGRAPAPPARAAARPPQTATAGGGGTRRSASRPSRVLPRTQALGTYPPAGARGRRNGTHRSADEHARGEDTPAEDGEILERGRLGGAGEVLSQIHPHPPPRALPPAHPPPPPLF